MTVDRKITELEVRADGARVQLERFAKGALDAATAADTLGVSVEKNDKKAIDFEKAWDRLQRRLDPVAASTTAFTRDLTLLNAGLDRGKGSVDNYFRSLDSLGTKLGLSGSESRILADEWNKLNAAMKAGALTADQRAGALADMAAQLRSDAVAAAAAASEEKMLADVRNQLRLSAKGREAEAWEQMLRDEAAAAATAAAEEKMLADVRDQLRLSAKGREAEAWEQMLRDEAAAATAAKAAVEELARAKATLASAVDQIRGKYDSLYAQQQRIRREMEMVDDAFMQGAISAKAAGEVSDILTKKLYEITKGAAAAKTGVNGVSEAVSLWDDRMREAEAEASMIIADQQRMTAEAQRQAAALNALLSIYDPMASELNALRKAETALTAAIARGGAGARNYEVALANVRKRLHEVSTAAENGNSALKSYQLVNFGQQIQDISVSLAGGQNPFLVLVQQVPQAVSAVGGLDNMMALLTRRAALTFYGITALAAPLALVTARALELDSELRTLNATLTLYGNTSHAAANLQGLATAIAAATGVAKSEIISAEVALNKFATLGEDAYRSIATVAAQQSAITGDAAAQIATDIATAMVKGVEGIVELDKKFNILDASTASYYRTLAEQGRTAEAVRQYMAKLGDQSAKAFEQYESTGGKAFREVKAAWNDLVDEFAKSSVMQAVLEGMSVILEGIASVVKETEVGDQWLDMSRQAADLRTEIGRVEESIRYLTDAQQDLGSVELPGVSDSFEADITRATNQMLALQTKLWDVEKQLEKYKKAAGEAGDATKGVGVQVDKTSAAQTEQDKVLADLQEANDELAATVGKVGLAYEYATAEIEANHLAAKEGMDDWGRLVALIKKWEAAQIKSAGNADAFNTATDRSTASLLGLAEAYRTGDAEAIAYAKALQSAVQQDPSNADKIVQSIYSQTSAQKLLNAAVAQYDASIATEGLADLLGASKDGSAALDDMTAHTDAWADVMRGAIDPLDASVVALSNQREAVAASVKDIAQRTAELQDQAVVEAYAVELMDKLGLSYAEATVHAQAQKSAVDLVTKAKQLDKASTEAMTAGNIRLAVSLQQDADAARDAADAVGKLAINQTSLAAAQSLGSQASALEEEVTLLQAELGLVGATSTERDRALALLKLQLTYAQAMLSTDESIRASAQSHYNTAVKLTNEYYKTAKELERAQEYMQIWTDFFSDVEAAGKDAFKNILSGAWDDAENFFSDFSDALNDMTGTLTYNAIVNLVTGTTSTSSTGTTSSGSTAVATGETDDTYASVNTVKTALTTASLASAATSTGGSSLAGNLATTIGGIAEDIAGIGTEVGTFVYDAVDTLSSVEGLVSGWVGSTVSGLIWDWDSTEEEIGSTIGSTIGTVIGASFGWVGAGIGSFLGDTIGGWIGSLFEDEVVPQFGFSFSDTGTGYTDTASYSLDIEDFTEEDAATAASEYATVLDELFSALGAQFNGSFNIGYADDEYFYQSSSDPSVAAYTYFATFDEAMIAALQDKLANGEITGIAEEAADEIATVLANGTTDDFETFVSELGLAAVWDDLLSTLETGTIDYTDSLFATAEDTVAAYLEELKSYQDLTESAGLSLDDFNDAYEESILRMIGLAEEGEEAYTDLEYDYLYAVYEIEAAADLLEQVGYTAEEAAATIDEALAELNATAVEDFADTLQETIDSLNGLDYVNSFQDYIDAYLDDQSYGELIGADLTALDGLFTTIIEAVLSEAGDLGTAVTELTAAYPEYIDQIWAAYHAVADTTDLMADAYAAMGDDLTSTLLTFDAETESGSAAYAGADLVLYEAVREAERAQEVYDYYADLVDDSIDTTEDLIDSNEDLIDALYSLQDTAADLRLDESLSTGSAYDLLIEAQTQYEEALSDAYNTSLDSDTRLDAIDDVNDLVSTYLDYAQQYYASSEDYVAIFDQTQSDLLGLSGDQIAELEAANDNLQDELDVLNSIQDSIDEASAAADLSANELTTAIETAGADLTTAISALSGVVTDYESGAITDYEQSTDWEAIVSAAYSAMVPSYTPTDANISEWAGYLSSGLSVDDLVSSWTDWGVESTDTSWMSAFGYANGGVFGGMASGVYDSPTMFKFANGGAFDSLGVLGEAGPEAILPLGRGADGGLGVRVLEAPEAANDQWGAPSFGSDGEAVAELRALCSELAEVKAEVKRLNATTAGGALAVKEEVAKGNSTSAKAARESARAASKPTKRVA